VSSRIRTLAVPALVLGGASALLWGPALMFPSALFFRDILHYYWQSHLAVADALLAGSLPQWNPGPSMGLPLLGDVHAGALYPPNILYLVLAYPRAYAWLLWGHHLAGGLGVFAFVRQQTGRILAGTLAAVAFMFSGYVVSLHCAGALMAGGAFVPWVLVSLSARSSPRRKIVTVSALVGMQALTGDPQSVLFSAIAALLFALQESPRRRAAATALGGFGLATALAAIQLLPAWEAFRYSSRAASTELVGDWTTHPLRLAELFLPFPFGGYLEKPQFWAWFTVHGPASTPFALSVYLGASTVLLAALGIARSRSSVFAIILFGLGTVLALGSYAGTAPLLEHVPPFRFFRYPEKYMFLATLGWSFLVGLGSARLEEQAPLPSYRLRGAAVVAVLLAALLAATVLLGPALLTGSDGVLSRAFRAESIAGPVHSAQASGTTALLVWVLSAASLYLVRRSGKERPVRIVLVTVVLVDLLLAARRIVWFEDIQLYSHRPAVVDAMRSQAPAGPWRFLRYSPALRSVTPHGSTPEQVSATRAWELMTLKSNLGGVFGLEEVSGYGAFALRRTMNLFSSLGSDPIRLAQFGAACFVLTASGTKLTEDPRVEATEEWPTLRLVLLKLNECVPRIHGVLRTIGVEGPDAAALALGSSTFSPSTAAVVEGEPSATFEPLTIDSLGVGNKSTVLTVQVPAGGGFLVFATSYYPGWTVTVDNQTATLQRTNLATMGVRLPEGWHRIEFHFLDPGLRLGAALSAVGLAIWLWLFRGAIRS